ncbi:glutathionylspermidine synthase family protein [Sporomusa malonica]|uniref:Glutathionylspermidine synthase preATP-grasp n=1 Tax=Sporomusa malonica TaxID=112901 RepID=A0A1W1ZQS2_9FIRM|nr:glutathionylspermidine synthase family protein [Sporomusa malonica]SMC50411.1 Glutathionylspermidine synthase preATP-grasp [Sporomusa malonica]
MDYRTKREALFNSIRQEDVFTWDYMYGQEYALAATCQLSSSEFAEITYAAGQLGSIFAKTVKMLQQGSDALLAELGIPAKTFGAARVPVLPDWPTTIGRFDFARTPKGLKMLEFNSDTPGGIVEAYYLNRKVCEYYNYKDVNAGLTRHIAEAFGAVVAEYRAQGYATGNIAFSALDWHDEDAGTARFLMNHSGLTACFVPLKDLRIYQDRLWRLADGELKPIDILYRLHPLGIMSEETDQDGYSSGEHLLSLVSRRKLAIINQPGALLAQTKALQALIWLLYENNEYFTSHEHKIIAAYMLPTYLENGFLGKNAYVVKPVLGREGGGITMYDANGALTDKDSSDCYWGQTMIYQQYAELEQITIETLQGYYQGSLLWGAFLVGGKASAVNARVGGRITDDLSYFLPIRLAE